VKCFVEFAWLTFLFNVRLAQFFVFERRQGKYFVELAWL
jgi:hypothetical protein